MYILGTLMTPCLHVFFPQGVTVYETVVPEVEEKELEKMVNPIVLEYFEHGDTKEVEVKGLGWWFPLCFCIKTLIMQKSVGLESINLDYNSWTVCSAVWV